MNRLVCLLLGLIFLTLTPAYAVPVVGASSGLAAPDVLYNFSELGLPQNTVVTNQYAGVVMNSLRQSPNTGFPNVQGATIGNFASGGGIETTNLILNFTGPITDVTFAFVTNPGLTTFRAFFGGMLVETTGPVPTTFNSSNNFFGFTSTLIDSVQIDTSQAGPGSALFDLLAFNTVTSVPEIDTKSGVLPVTILVLMSILLLDSRKRSVASA